VFITFGLCQVLHFEINVNMEVPLCDITLA